jgi:outer membrane protein assembly factor BamB
MLNVEDYVWVVKTDFEGNEVWNRTFGGKDNDYACCVEVLKDGFVIAGHTVNQSKGYAWLESIRRDI